jgi:hypothetical protein
MITNKQCQYFLWMTKTRWSLSPFHPIFVTFCYSRRLGILFKAWWFGCLSFRLSFPHQPPHTLPGDCLLLPWPNHYPPLTWSSYCQLHCTHLVYWMSSILTWSDCPLLTCCSDWLYSPGLLTVPYASKVTALYLAGIMTVLYSPGL